MFARLFVATAVAFSSSNAAAIESFIGTWVGDVKEQGSDAPYQVSMSIFERNGRLFHNSRYAEPLNCVGGGVTMEHSAAALRFVEFIVENREICADGTIRVYANGDDRLIWEWFYPNGKYAARADLIRSQ